jgi:hypothetical protein
MKRASSRKKAVKVPPAAAVADATSDEEQQVSAREYGRSVSIGKDFKQK